MKIKIERLTVTRFVQILLILAIRDSINNPDSFIAGMYDALTIFK